MRIPKLPISLFFLQSLLFLILLAHFFEWLCPIVLDFGCDVEYFPNDYSNVLIFFLGVLLAPIIETFLFQYLPTKLFLLVKRKWNINKVILILFSGILFGMAHDYNLITIIDGIISGIIFILIFLKFNEEKTQLSGFWATFLIHALYNFYAFLIDIVFKL